MRIVIFPVLLLIVAGLGALGVAASPHGQEAINLSPSGAYRGEATLCNEYAAFNAAGVAVPTNRQMSDSSTGGTASGSCPVPSSTPHGAGTEVAEIAFDEPPNAIIGAQDQTITIAAGVNDPNWIGSLKIWFEGTALTVPFNQLKNARTGSVGVNVNLIAAGYNGPATLCATAIPVNGMETTFCERYFVQNNPSGANYVAIPPGPNTLSALNYYADGLNGDDDACDGKSAAPASAPVNGHCAWGADIMGHFDWRHHGGNVLPAYGVLNVAPDTTYNMPATAYRPTVVSAPMTLRSAIPGTQFAISSVKPQVGVTTGGWRLPVNLLHMDGFSFGTDHINFWINGGTPWSFNSTPYSAWFSNCSWADDAGSAGASASFGVGGGIRAAGEIGNNNIDITECTSNAAGLGGGGVRLWRNFTGYYSSIAIWFSDLRFSNSRFFHFTAIQNSIKYYTQAFTTGPGGTAMTVVSYDPSFTGKLDLCQNVSCAGFGGTQTATCSPCGVIYVSGVTGIGKQNYTGAGNPAFSEICWLSAEQGASQTAARFTQVRAASGVASFRTPQAGCDTLQTTAYNPASNNGCSCYVVLLVKPFSSGPAPVAGDQFVALHSDHPDGPEHGNGPPDDPGSWNVYGQFVQIYGGSFDWLTQGCQPCGNYSAADGVTTSGTRYTIAGRGAPALQVNDFIWLTGAGPQSWQSLQVLDKASPTSGTLAGRYTASPTLFAVNGFTAPLSSANTYTTAFDGATYFANAAPNGSAINFVLKGAAKSATITDMSVCVQSSAQDCTAIPTRVTFNGGQTGCSGSRCGATPDIATDYVPIRFPANSTLLVRIQGASNSYYKNGVANTTSYSCATGVGVNAMAKTLDCTPIVNADQVISVESINVVPPRALDVSEPSAWRKVKSAQFMLVESVIDSYNLIPGSRWLWASGQNYTIVQSTIVNSAGMVWNNSPRCTGNGWGLDMGVFDSIWPGVSYCSGPAGANQLLPGLSANNNVFMSATGAFGSNRVVNAGLTFADGSALDTTANFRPTGRTLTTTLAGNPSRGGCPIFPVDLYGKPIPCSGGLVGAAQ